jgi:phosphate acetyltransferase
MTNLPQEFIENIVFDELAIGQSASSVRILTLPDMQAFAAVSGDFNPTHIDPEYAASTLRHDVIAHSMWSGSLISGVLGTVLPGPGTVYLEQSMRFLKPVSLGDALTITVTVTAKDENTKQVTLDCIIVNQNGNTVLSGTAVVIAPTNKVRLLRALLPEFLMFDPQARMKALLDKVRALPAIRCAVVHPCDTESLQGAIDAAKQGLIVPVLIGPESKIRSVAAEADIDLGDAEIVSVSHSHEAAIRAAEMAAAGNVEALMKGSLHTDELMHAVVTSPGLRTKRRLSHVFRFDVPMYNKPLLISDAALNIHPTLSEKVDIIQNAIDLARALGTEVPKVAILSAMETVNPKVSSTLDAAALCKMADRGQIKGGVLDGPLAFDNAISAEAARIKGITSPVAGDVDILIVPDLESGNMLAKQLSYLAGASSCGVVVGARVPIALTSRADNADARMASAALAVLLAYQNRQVPL